MHLSILFGCIRISISEITPTLNYCVLIQCNSWFNDIFRDAYPKMTNEKLDKTPYCMIFFSILKQHYIFKTIKKNSFNDM